ncbi:kinesin-like protein Klp68D [Toxorhynchites rutilus septentrionalis]|uniref:kinesin-like protein Klp68D n=1 Tax=Toxorhynchites rutilus septentrionalis TaxID=329112 RepID=UPI00247AD4B9|nr:kinesin-like protein Klp68D [Toxorhynchites rutilus septentrionalis]XP_055620904.1 kinesin-like protein Klp68D [Toxorhynchites rutilus septentrionalis]
MNRSIKQKSAGGAKNECVQVVVRCRPLNNKEQTGNFQTVVDVYPSRGVIEILNCNEASRENKKMFTYDAVYDWASTQQQLYDEVVRPLVYSVLEGFNGCVFAYGQTGTGKTHTMEGIKSDVDQKGIIPRAFEQIWAHINRTQNMNFLVAVSYLEIYMEELRDLLKPNSTTPLELREREGGIVVPNLHSVLCKSVDDMLNVMYMGNKNRTVGFTNMNEHSSRSHAIFLIKIEMCEVGSTLVKVGKLNLIDLAGSERQSKTGATAERLKEASKINRALSSLGNVISALAEKSPHVPYRDSKLTRLLQDSLGGNSKTIMIANISPSEYNYNETLTTLRYANRAKTIENKPVMNEDPQDTKLREYQEEIARLRLLISERRHKGKKMRKKQFSGSEEENEDEQEEEEEEEEDEKDNKQEFEELDAKAQEALMKEREVTNTLASKLKELEGQLVKGGKNILDTYTERQMELEKRMAEITERKKREIEMQQQLELQEESTMEIRETFTSLQQEVELKTRKLKKCYTKCMALKQELQDTRDEHNRDRRELEMTQNELIKELKRLLLVIDNFVPAEVKSRLYTQAKYDDETEEWFLNSNMILSNHQMMTRPVADPNRRRPMSEYALHMAKSSKPEAIRYRGENIMNYELDMPLRTTYEYSNPKVSASLQAVLAEAMQTEDDIDITDQSNYASIMKQRLDRITRRNVVQDAQGTTGSCPNGTIGSSAIGSAINGIPPSSSGSSNSNGIGGNRARSSIYNRGMSAAPTFGAHSGVSVAKKVPPASAASFPKARGLIPK